MKYRFDYKNKTIHLSGEATFDEIQNIALRVFGSDFAKITIQTADIGGMTYTPPKNYNTTEMSVQIKLLKQFQNEMPTQILEKGSILTVGESTARDMIDRGLAEMVYPSPAKPTNKSNAVELPSSTEPKPQKPSNINPDIKRKTK